MVKVDMDEMEFVAMVRFAELGKALICHHVEQWKSYYDALDEYAGDLMLNGLGAFDSYEDFMEARLRSIKVEEI